MPAAVVALAAATASADTVDMKFVGTGAGRGVRVYFDGANHNLFAGQLNHRIVNSSGPDAPGVGNLTTYCIDIWESVNGGVRTFEVVDIDEAPISPSRPTLNGAQADALGRLFTFSNRRHELNNRSYNAAFQIALWEIMIDLQQEGDDLDAEAGLFRASNLTSSTRTHLASMLDAAGDGDVAIATNLTALAALGVQDQVYQVIIPLPTTAGLAAVGLAAVGLRRRR
ncbi:MAG: hypothetical protein AAFX79_09460 [Planctomycetota bacterium]